MPTYEFICIKCSHKEDMFYRMKSVPNFIMCSKCGGNMPRQLGAGAGIIFKGKGFYETDYKRNGNESREDKKKT